MKRVLQDREVESGTERCRAVRSGQRPLELARESEEGFFSFKVENAYELIFLFLRGWE